jgi:hypothetical protein
LGVNSLYNLIFPDNAVTNLVGFGAFGALVVKKKGLTTKTQKDTKKTAKTRRDDP